MLWVLLGLEVTHASICFGGLQRQRTGWFYSESVAYEPGGSRKKNLN